jgi:hypothetical protein
MKGALNTIANKVSKDYRERTAFQDRARVGGRVCGIVVDLGSKEMIENAAWLRECISLHMRKLAESNPKVPWKNFNYSITVVEA